MDADTITRLLGGRWHGSYGSAFCPAHENRRTPALSVSNGADGRLLLKCHTGCAFTDILAAIRGLGIKTAGQARTPAPERYAYERDEQRRWKLARACWAETVPIGGTLAESYLRGRGIAVQLPTVLRFHPNCWHSSGRRHPAMVAKVELRGRGVAVHRTYLDPAGGKAKLEPAKSMLGPCRGGAVCLSDGPGPLVVVEGIETGLSLLEGLAAHRPRVLASLSTSGVRSLELPSLAGTVYLAPDGDEPGRLAAMALGSRAARSGWQVRLMPAPDGLDWNDIGQEEAAA